MLGKQGSMLLSLDNLPPGISRKDLKNLMQRAVDGNASACRLPPGFRFTSNVLHCTILRISNQATGETSYRGLATIAPPKCALAAIAALNGTDLNGHRLQVRRFRHHSFGQPETAAGDLPGPADAAPQTDIPYLLELVKTTAPAPQPAPDAPENLTGSAASATDTAAPPIPHRASPQAAAAPGREPKRPPNGDFPLFAH